MKDVPKLPSLWVEYQCPEHGLERFRIKIIRKFNMKPDIIVPKFRSRPKSGDLSCLLVGRNVSNREVKNYLAGYFRQLGLIEAILRMRLKV